MPYIMRQVPAKSEEAVTDADEAWSGEAMVLKRMGPEGEDLPDTWMVTALKCLRAAMIKDRIAVNTGIGE